MLREQAQQLDLEQLVEGQAQRMTEDDCQRLEVQLEVRPAQQVVVLVRQSLPGQVSREAAACSQSGRELA